MERAIVSNNDASAALPDGVLTRSHLHGSPRLWDALTTLIVVVIVLGTFNPIDNYLAGGETTPGIPLSAGATPTTYILAASLILIALYAMLGRSFAIVCRTGSILLIALPTMALFTAWWSPLPVYTMNRSARLIQQIGFALLFAEYYDFGRLIKFLTRSVFIALLCSIAITVVRPDLGLAQMSGDYANAWRGATIHKNILGQVCSIGVLISFFAIIVRKNNLLFSITTLFASMGVLALSQSASSEFAATASILFAACLNAVARRGRLAKINLIALLVFVLTVATVVATDPDLILGVASRDATLTGRTYIWTAVWSVINQSPFWGQYYGFWGIDSVGIRTIWSQVQYNVPHAHDSWLDIWLQLGLPGLIDLIVIFLISILSGFGSYMRTGEASVVFSMSLLVSLLVRSGPEVEFTDPFPSGLFWLALAYGCIVRTKHTVAKPLPEGRSQRAATRPPHKGASAERFPFKST